MRPHIVAVGKVKKAWIRDGIHEYGKRLPELQITEVKDSTPDKEGQKILSLMSDYRHLILLSEWGKPMTSIAFADFLHPFGADPILFIIGGPDGVSQEVNAQADHLLSLSPMTFTHEMARLFLVEQLYRAKSIWQNTGYHR
jgi:23S rRNA (pseudouridine1915-N3)-methyltransferase